VVSDDILEEFAALISRQNPATAGTDCMVTSKWKTSHHRKHKIPKKKTSNGNTTTKEENEIIALLGHSFFGRNTCLTCCTSTESTAIQRWQITDCKWSTVRLAVPCSILSHHVHHATYRRAQPSSAPG
jgi:hypothetical protein